MQSHKAKVEKVDLTVAVYVARYDSLTGRLAKVGFACFGSSAVCSHIDNTAVGERLKTDGAQ